MSEDSERDWTPYRIGSEQGRQGRLAEVLSFSFALVWYGLLVFFVVVDPSSLCMVAFFGLVGLLPLKIGLASRRGRLRYGGAQFELLAPAVLGARLEGLVHIPHAIGVDVYVRVTLLSRRRGDSDSADAVLSRTVDFVSPPPSPAGEAGRIPVHVEVPADGIPSDPPNTRGGCYWQLQLYAERNSPGLDLLFEVPVARPRR